MAELEEQRKKLRAVILDQERLLFKRMQEIEDLKFSDTRANISYFDHV